MLNFLIFAAGLAALVAGADVLVRGASRLALSFGISPLVVGLTIVAFGTSAPEVAVSAGAVLSGQTDLAIGNVVGSNIFNVLFILGLSALITPLVVHVQLIRQMLHRFGKRQMFNLHHKMDDAAARLAAEAVEQLLFRIHGERCGFLSVEGA